MSTRVDQPERALRPSGYASWIYELGYGRDSPLYDLVVWWGLLPLGGEVACRETFVRWCTIEPQHRVASLCCGTGTNERTMLRLAPGVRIRAIDLGAGQVARARRKDSSGQVEYTVGDASNTGWPEASFDRVLIAFALHEMPGSLRLAVLREAARLCAVGGRVIAIEHATPRTTSARILQSLWWFVWLPGNPETETSRDLQRRGLANEMEQAGLVVVDRRFTRPDWVEGAVGEPAAGCGTGVRGGRRFPSA